MIAINNISFYFGSRALYDEASLHIKPKDRIGLIGANGTGKSTLLRLIIGEYKVDSGDISMSNECTIGFLNQDLLSFQTEDSILEVAMQAFEKQNALQKEIDELLEQLETNYTDKVLERLSEAQEHFGALDGYSMQSKAEAILEGLGFSTEALSRPLHTFSGGWRMRVMLAKLLLQKPSLLMLDEPTNHLDLPSIQWLENYLNSYEGAVIVVSHDRQFLDNCISSIVEVSQAQLNSYPGNYSFYLEEKALRNEIQKGSFENQQSMIKQTERFIERFKAKASKSRQVQSRVKALERLDVVDDVMEENAKVNFQFRFSIQPGRFITQIKDVSKAYGDLVILKKSTISIERGDKIALIGANGKGKSTVLRIIAGVEAIEGEVSEGHNVIRSFYAQHQLESLNLENSLLDELKQAGSKKTEQELRTVLGCFLFSSDDAFKKIKVLSGGEKSRVALAKTLISEANYLLLDEPTNHLDIQSVNILIQALQQYEGTFITISHDRHFVSNVANKIWYIDEEIIKEYPGTYAEYQTWQANQLKNKVSEPVKEAPKVVQQAKPVVSSKTPERKKQENQLSKIEAEISELEKLKSNQENLMADSTIYTNPDKLKTTQDAYKITLSKLSQANLEWEKLIDILG